MNWLSSRLIIMTVLLKQQLEKHYSFSSLESYQNLLVGGI